MPIHPQVEAARRLAAELLAPAAAEVDAGTVPRSHLRALGEAGLLGLYDPAAGVPNRVARRVQEVLAGADPATWFVSVQHHGPVRMLAATPTAVRDELLPRLARGELVAGIAFSHLRRWPDRPVRATRGEGGWRFDGDVAWYTGWGVNDVMVLGGATADGRVVFGMTEAAASAALRPSAPLRMAAMASTSTVRLAVAGLVVPDDRILLEQPVERWLRDDARATVNVVPAVLGVTSEALRLLAATAEGRGSSAGLAAAQSMSAQLHALRERNDHLVDEVDPDERHAERLALRGEAQALAVSATAAAVSAGGGAAMSLDAPAQRLARAALFLLVQAQTGPSREATLRRWA